MTPQRARASARPQQGSRARISKQAPSKTPRRRRRNPRGRALLGAAVGVLLGFTLTFLLTVFVWSTLSGPGSGTRVAVRIEPHDVTAVAEALRTAGALQSPTLFAWYLRVLRPSLEPEAGVHLLDDSLSPSQIANRIGRTSGRPRVRVLVPEGFNVLQLGARLEELSICGNDEFQEQAKNPALLRELGIDGPSAEGRLFPASYEFYVNSPAASVIALMAKEMNRRFDRLVAAHPGALDELSAQFSFAKSDVLTLASVIEKETGRAEERPLIASVFYNRLRGGPAHPSRLLQSDPTAAYGCLVAASAAPTCREYRGRVTPAMLKDALNRYNTYRHAGLPPGPIANPGERSIEAALAPAASDFLFFVAGADGKHVFSRTFAEHTGAIRVGQPPSNPASPR